MTTRVSRRNRLKPAPTLVEVTERQNRNLAGQLHEGVLQLLSAASILTRVVGTRARNLPAQIPELPRLVETVDSAIDEARLLIRHLQTPGAEESGLRAGLQDLASAANTKCPCELECDLSGHGAWNPRAALAVLRMAQEAVHCALDRSRVSKISIRLTGTSKAAIGVTRFQRRGQENAERPLPQAASRARHRPLTLAIQANGRNPPSARGREFATSVLLIRSHARVLGGRVRIQSDHKSLRVECRWRASA
jgi:hypothetical protein